MSTELLLDPSIEATNWPAEQAIRPAVANRKSVGGNRTPEGAQTQAILMSLLRTGHQNGIGDHELFTPILCGPLPAADADSSKNAGAPVAAGGGRRPHAPGVVDATDGARGEDVGDAQAS
ncbi:MAG: hypothetical protein ACRD1X_19655 [Vicinamibacteria bacterium]